MTVSKFISYEDPVAARDAYIEEVKAENREVVKKLNSVIEERNAIEQAYDEMCDYAGKLENQLALYASESQECSGECCAECRCTEDCAERITDDAEERECDCCAACTDSILSNCIRELVNNFETVERIRNIYYCDEPGKEKTIVVFNDGTKVIKELVPGDIFDLNVGVALCIAEKMFGSKSKFHKKVNKLVKASNKKKAVKE